MKIDPEDFQVHEGDTVHLDQWPTLVKPVYRSKKKYQALLEEQVAELSDLQPLLYASNRHAVLLIFQAMESQRVAARGFNCELPRPASGCHQTRGFGHAGAVSRKTAFTPISPSAEPVQSIRFSSCHDLAMSEVRHALKLATRQCSPANEARMRNSTLITDLRCRKPKLRRRHPMPPPSKQR